MTSKAGFSWGVRVAGTDPLCLKGAETPISPR